MASECVASVIVADQETLEQIQLDESEFYGTDSYDEDQPSMIVADDHDSGDELLSLSEDETSTREGIRSMSTPADSTTPGPSVTPADDDEEVKIINEFDRGCGCDEECYKQFSISEVKDFRLI